MNSKSNLTQLQRAVIAAALHKRSLWTALMESAGWENTIWVWYYHFPVDILEQVKSYIQANRKIFDDLRSYVGFDEDPDCPDPPCCEYKLWHAMFDSSDPELLRYPSHPNLRP